MNRLKIVIYVIVCILILSAAGCNTMKGAGQDIEKGGEALKQSAEKHGQPIIQIVLQSED